MKQLLGRLRHGEVGASAVEYALLASLIAALIAVSVTVLGSGVLGLYDTTCRDMASAIDGSTC